MSHLKVWNIKTKQKLYLHIAATYSLLQMPFKYLTPNFSFTLTADLWLRSVLDDGQHYKPRVLKEWPFTDYFDPSVIGWQDGPVLTQRPTALNSSPLKKNKLFKKIYVHTYKQPVRPVDSETGIYSNSKLNSRRTTGVRWPTSECATENDFWSQKKSLRMK